MHSTGTAVTGQGLSNTRRTNDLLHEGNQGALAGQKNSLPAPGHQKEFSRSSQRG